MLDNHISDKERLYRVIIRDPSWWSYKRNKPSTAAFKDANGVSVDRAGGRPNEDCIKYLTNRFRRNLRAIVSLTGQECRACDTFPKYARSKNNKYHSLILDGPDIVEISTPKALYLCNKANLDFFNE